MTSLLPGPDGLLRYAWCLSTPDYIAYHDHEWGYPVTDDRHLFEKLTLEGEYGYGAQWAGQGAPLARKMSAGSLMRILADEAKAG